MKKLTRILATLCMTILMMVFSACDDEATKAASQGTTNATESVTEDSGTEMSSTEVASGESSFSDDESQSSSEQDETETNTDGETSIESASAHEGTDPANPSREDGDSGITSDKQQSIAESQYQVEKVSLEAAEKSQSAIRTFPCVYINTVNKVRPTSKKVYLSCTVDIQNTADAYLMSGTLAEVRVRGNSTALNSQPPLKLKFAEKQSFVGIHGGQKFKTWVLLKTNYYLAGSYTAFKLGKTILGSKYYCSDAQFVNLFVNGEFWGIRVACEQNQIKKNRVNVKEATSTGQAANSFGYFFELDNHAGEDGSPYFTINHKAYTITDMAGNKKSYPARQYSIKNDVISSSQAAFMGKYMQGVWTVLCEATVNKKAYLLDNAGNLTYTDSITPEEAVRRVIDIDSAVNMYILYECFYDFDRGAGSFFFAKDFSAGAQYSKVTFLAPWDFNYSQFSTSPIGFHTAVATTNGNINDTENSWFIALMANEWFRKAVSQRWTALGANALKGTCYAVNATVNSLANDAAIAGDSSKIKGAKSFLTFTIQRIGWLDTQFNGTWPYRTGDLEDETESESESASESESESESESASESEFESAPESESESLSEAESESESASQSESQSESEKASESESEST